MDNQIMHTDTDSNDSMPPSTKHSGVTLPVLPVDNAESAFLDSSDDDSSLPILKTKKRVQRFSESDSDVPKEKEKSVQSESEQSDHAFSKSDTNKSRIRILADSGDDDSDSGVRQTTNTHTEGTDGDIAQNGVLKKYVKNKSRLRKVASSDDESDNSPKKPQITGKYAEQQLRMKKKNNKLRDKFKNLLSSREKGMETNKNDGGEKSGTESIGNDDDNSDSAHDELSSIEKIKQKIKDRSASLKMSICDPDTSDEETDLKKKVYRPKKVQKRTKLTSPKPQRMSAKQAMENMQKIKSESNRMLREREVSLPYHKPKALSLQDIMKRRKPAVSSDGKALPIKMNGEQLKHYAHLLEQRQKEMMELCKSDSEEETFEMENKETPVSDALDKVNETVKERTVDVSDASELSNKTTAQIVAEVDEIINNEVDPRIRTGHLIESRDLETKYESVLEDKLTNKSGNDSAEMELVYNDSIEEDTAPNDVSKNNIQSARSFELCNKVEQRNEEFESAVTINEENIPAIPDEKGVSEENNTKASEVTKNTEKDSQLISLYYDSEKMEHAGISSVHEKDMVVEDTKSNNDCVNAKANPLDNSEVEDFPDDDINMDDIDIEDIDNIIENAEIIKDNDNGGAMNSPALIRDIPVLNVKPKLTGAPGMVINLDGSDPIVPKKLTGVELLKERFTFFAKLKTPEEIERERERRQKPGTQHLKLKQELEDIIAEQRSLEWSKRLDNEKQQQMEMDAIRGDASDEDDIDKIEAQIRENDVEKESSSESEEEDLLEDDVLIEDKPKRKNPLLADEAEESDAEETVNDNDDVDEAFNNDEIENENEYDSSEEESSESEDEQETKPKKSRILKAFEDSDDEEISKLEKKETVLMNNKAATEILANDNTEPQPLSPSYGIMESQDDVIQLAQATKQLSSDVFTSQGSALNITQNTSRGEEDLGTQTFSIMDSNKTVTDISDPDKLTIISDVSDKPMSDDLDKLIVLSDTQPFNDDNLDAVVDMCSGNFQTQNCIDAQVPTTQSQISQSQDIGEDVLDMCTGKFYDNEFISANDDILNTSDDLTQEPDSIDAGKEKTLIMSDTKLAPDSKNKPQDTPKNDVKEKQNEDMDILKSVLEELNEPDFREAKPLKFFSEGKSQNKENEQNATNAQVKKRLVIESDDESKDTNISEPKKKKKFKKKKLEQRALQISDDEEDSEEGVEEEDYISDIENDNENEEERMIEYDSEENEVEVKPQTVKKKKRKAAEFFEQEAELTSEDEWVGSGDEDEAGLDRMEREAGDDETFHQGRLQRELGQIHMRDVLDQDKREVRLIQELLFEDGDLGAGGRQRKFRWRNADGEEVTGTLPDEFADTQEEEFESEEQWRKQRHEREMFLRQMKNGDKKDDLNVSVNRTTIIKANLTSRTMSSLLEEVNQSKAEAPKTVVVPEKKTAKDIPSPVKKPFSMFQQNFHGSLLTRGQGALARLAALAAPLDAPALQPRPTSSKRNFVFAAVTPDDEPKVTKRKAESNVGTPRLVKKMKTEEKQSRPKSSLLEFLKT